MDTSFTLDEPLKATGHMLQRSGDTAAVVVVGGTALNLLGVVARATADVDIGPSSRHFKDLVALHPTSGELREAARWIHTQDPSPAMAELVAKVIEYVVDRSP